MMAPVTRTGRRSKGDRNFVGCRISTPKADAMDQFAKAEVYQYVSDWLSDLVEERLANTKLHAVPQQEEFPLGRLASYRGRPPLGGPSKLVIYILDCFPALRL